MHIDTNWVIKQYNDDILSPFVERKMKELNITDIIDKSFIDNMTFLGSGNFGKVYKTKDNNVLKMSSILKKINSYYVSDKMISDSASNIIREFENESNQLMLFTKLRSEFPNNILQIFETRYVLIENDTFPVNMITMEYIDGTKFKDFLLTCNEEQFNKIVLECLKLLFNLNIRGYFHNDINVGNIIIVNNKTPVLVDYSFSKIINKKNKFPIECTIFVNEISNIIPHRLYNVTLKNIVKLIFELSNKYLVYTTNFIEKILMGTGIFSLEDYLNLESISDEDINKLHDCFK